MRLKDVAERAGVSVKTVSNVVNGYTHVSPETRAHVQAVIDETGYRPNVAARNLRKGRAGVIALALPELGNPYFSELAGLVVDAAAEQGWTVLVDQTDGRRDRELDVAQGFRHNIIDGLILSPYALGFEDLLHRGPDDIPMVLLGERITRGPADHVAIDNVAAARAATGHLLTLGRRRVAALGQQEETPDSSGVARLRRQGWARALRDGGLEDAPSLVATVTDFSREEGYRAMGALLDGGAHPDAVFAFNDALALGALRQLADRGYDVPGEVAVIGVDDSPEGRFSVPRLSTVAPDKRAIAQHAVRMLAERLEPGGADIEARDVRAGFEVLARESTLG